MVRSKPDVISSPLCRLNPTQITPSFLVSLEALQFTSVAGAADQDGAVFLCGDELATVGGPGESEDKSGIVVGDTGLGCAVVDVLDPDRIVLAPGNQQLPVV